MTVLKPAKVLSHHLKPKIVLEIASSAFLKLGETAGLHQHHLIENSDGLFVYEYGVAVERLEFKLTADEAFSKLANVVSDLNKVKFHLLWLPVSRGLDHCTADIHGNVIVRTIEYYEPRTDEMLTRYDILVEDLTKAGTK